MDAPSAFSWSTAIYLSLQSSLLLFTPSVIVNMLVFEPRRPTDLELYLSRSIGLIGFAFAAALLLLTGILPVTSSVDHATRGPYAFATVFVTTLYHAATAMYIWMHNFSPVGASTPLGATLGTVISGTLACLGLWVTMFGEDVGRTSRTTGGDKRTSAYPFENREANSEKKKALRKGL